MMYDIELTRSDIAKAITSKIWERLLEKFHVVQAQEDDRCMMCSDQLKDTCLMDDATESLYCLNCITIRLCTEEINNEIPF